MGEVLSFRTVKNPVHAFGAALVIFVACAHAADDREVAVGRIMDATALDRLVLGHYSNAWMQKYWREGEVSVTR